MDWMTRVQFVATEIMGFFLLTTIFRLTLEPTQPPTQWVQWALTLELK